MNPWLEFCGVLFFAMAGMPWAALCCCESVCSCCTELPSTVTVTIANLGGWNGDYVLTRGDLFSGTCVGTSNPCAYYREDGCPAAIAPLIVFTVHCDGGQMAYSAKLIHDCFLGFPEAEFSFTPSPAASSPIDCTAAMENLVLTPAGGSDPPISPSCSDGDDSDGTLTINAGGGELLMMALATDAGRKGGPGTELKRLLRWWEWMFPKDCQCAQHAAEMDRRGSAWCRENVETIVGWLEAEARKSKLLRPVFSRDIAKQLVLKAIDHAERKG